MEETTAARMKPAPAARLTDRFAAAFEVHPAARESTLTAMLDLREREYASCWFQLVVALAIASLLAEAPRTQNAVRTLVTVKHHSVEVRLVLVAPAAEAALQVSLRQRIAVIAQVPPVVSILAVPDFASLETVVSSLERTRAPATIPAPVLVPDLTEVRTRIDQALERAWPASAGRLLRWDLAFSNGGSQVELAHLGAPLGPTSEGLLARVRSSESGLTVGVRDVAYAGSAEADGLDGISWLPSFARAVEVARTHGGLHLCVTNRETRIRERGPTAGER